MFQVFKPSRINILEICPIYTDVCETLHYELMLKIHYITDLLSYQFGTVESQQLLSRAITELYSWHQDQQEEDDFAFSKRKLKRKSWTACERVEEEFLSEAEDLEFDDSEFFSPENSENRTLYQAVEDQSERVSVFSEPDDIGYRIPIVESSESELSEIDNNYQRCLT